MIISIIGAGSFGTALAISLANAGKEVRLWGRDSSQILEMQSTGINKTYLAKHRLPKTIVLTSDLNSITESDIFILAIPMQELENFLKTYAPKLNRQNVIACSKGIDLFSGKGPSEIIGDAYPNSHIAFLTGPSFAEEIALGMPTALTLACANDRLAGYLQASISSEFLRIYRTRDLKGAEMASAIKNVIAIACGACTGAGLGENARAALMTRGFAEMVRVGKAFGAEPETFSGLSGMGDLFLTATSEKSRNFSFGLAVGSETDFDGVKTIEGIKTAEALLYLAKEKGLELPVVETVFEIVNKKINVNGAINKLMSRPQIEE